MPEDAQLNVDAEQGKSGSGGEQGYGYEDHSAQLWSVYLAEALKNDGGIVENMKGNTDGILVFTGLFSATVAAFIIESYKTLQPDSGDTTVLLLAQISQQLAAAADGTRFSLPSPGPDNAPFRAPSSSLRVNILWFISLVLSLSCALIATLMQQWARRYLQGIEGPTASTRRGRIHAYLHIGMQNFRMTSMVEALPALLHVSVFLFFTGLVEFVFQINTTVAWAVLAVVTFVAAVYLLLTILPLIYLNCPYQTPLSALFRALVRAIVFSLPTALSLALDCLPRRSWRRAIQLRTRRTISRWRLLLSRRRVRGTEAAARFEKGLTYEAMRWTMQNLDENRKWENFVDGITPYISSPDDAVAPITVEAMLVKAGLGRRLGYLLTTALFPGYFNTPTRARRNQRLMSCMSCIRSITLSLLPSMTIRWDQVFAPVGPPLYILCHDEDPDVAIPAACTAAMVSLATLVQLQSEARRVLPVGRNEDKTFFLTIPQLLQSGVLHNLLMSLKPTNSLNSLRPENVLQQLTLRHAALQYLPRVVREMTSAIGFSLNVVILADRILPHLRTASPESLAIAWSTLTELVWYSSSGKGMEGLEALRTRIQSAADELGVQELAQCVDGELPPGASMDSPYTKLYDLLRPAFDYQRTPVDPVEPHPDTALAAARSSTPSQYLPDTEKQGVLQTQSSAPPSPVPHGPSRGSSVSSKRKLDEESQ